MDAGWLRLLPSADLPPGGPPLRLEPAGLNTALVLFRTSTGEVAAFAEACPHVGTARATLARGTVEPNGLRCRFHGWKFDLAGRCIDVPDLPRDTDFGRFPRALAYEVRERAGGVWVRDRTLA